MEHLDNIHIDHFFSSDMKTFIGEIQVRNNASGTLRSLVSGSLYRREIRCWLAGLEYFGTLDESGMRIQCGQISCIGRCLPQAGQIGSFNAVRTQEHAGLLNITWKVQCRISIVRYCQVTDRMFEALDRNGASIEVLRTWQSRKTLVVDTLFCSETLLPSYIRGPLIRELQRILTVEGRAEQWYSVVFLLDKCAYCCACDNFLEALPLTSMAVLHLVVAMDASKKNECRFVCVRTMHCL